MQDVRLFPRDPVQADEQHYRRLANRNKRGVVIDLSLAAGKAVFLRLVEDADVVVENYHLDSERFQQALRDACAGFATDALAQRLEAEQVPFAKINPRDAVIHDPQVRAMEALWEFDHLVAGHMRQARPPARFWRNPGGDLPLLPGAGRTHP